MSRIAALAVLTLTALAAALAAQDTSAGTVTQASTSASTNTTDVMVASIRRQLMTDNYDYMSSESEETFPARRTQPSPAPEPAGAPAAPRERSLPPLGDHVDDIYMPRVRDLDAATAAARPATDRTVDKNDLLYYVHDDMLATDDDIDDVVDEQTATPKATYKVLKVKRAGGGGRRSGSVGRFLQEETADGVAIVSLDRQPFPEFRLPRARRQYMAPPGPRPRPRPPPAPRSAEDEALSREISAMFSDAVLDTLTPDTLGDERQPDSTEPLDVPSVPPPV